MPAHAQGQPQCMPFSAHVPGLEVKYLNEGPPINGKGDIWVYLRFKSSGREMIGYLRRDGQFCPWDEAKTWLEA